jgi:hypothetical protein
MRVNLLAFPNLLVNQMPGRPAPALPRAVASPDLQSGIDKGQATSGPALRLIQKCCFHSREVRSR